MEQGAVTREQLVRAQLVGPAAATAVNHYGLVVNPLLPAIPMFTLAGSGVIGAASRWRRFSPRGYSLVSPGLPA
jgi:hypothetical protein